MRKNALPPLFTMVAWRRGRGSIRGAGGRIRRLSTGRHEATATTGSAMPRILHSNGSISKKRSAGGRIRRLSTGLQEEITVSGSAMPRILHSNGSISKKRSAEGRIRTCEPLRNGT
jgi:uncharacterized protein YfaP (DUF2135 family)